MNNPSPNPHPLLSPAIVDYAVIGREIAPSTGTVHLQGYVFLKKKMRRSQVSVLLPGAWLDIAKGSHTENFDYCTKGGDYKEVGQFPEEPELAGAGFWKEFIASARAGTAEDTHPQQFVQYNAFCVKMAKENPPKVADLETLDNVWLVGIAGAGKSRKARQDYPDFFDKSINKWWDGYQGQPTVLLDDFDKSHAVLAHHLKRWADRYAFSVEVKGTLQKRGEAPLRCPQGPFPVRALLHWCTILGARRPQGSSPVGGEGLGLFPLRAFGLTVS